MSKHNGKRIWIIGASSGIGEALARELSARGAILALSARSAGALEKLRDELEGVQHVVPLDVSDAQAMHDAVENVKNVFEDIDSVVFLAAQYQPMELEALNLAQVKQMLDVNLMGAFHLIHSIMPVLRQQKRGQLALCGSVAGYVGLPHAQPYSSTKAAIRNIAQSLRAELKDLPEVDIKLISPGFVKTPLTDKNDFPMPCILEPAQAARYLADGLEARGFEVHFPKRFTFAMKVLALLPYPLYFYLMRTFV